MLRTKLANSTRKLHKHTFKEISKTQYAITRNPFDNRNELTTIDTGEIAIAIVNVDQAKKTQSDILESMCGNPTANYTFKKKDTAITMKHGSLSR